nr:ParB N-terminal domain-containing protein [Pseudoflavonifractor sp. 524-17]
MSLQKGRGQVQARSKADEGRAVLKYIDVDDLLPSEDNFYPMSAIDELAGLIELSGGVKQPGLVVPLGGGKYKLLSGHRRRLASLQLVKQGKEAYRKMPCMVEDTERETGPEAEELRAIDEEILIITTNGHREKTDWVKVQEATRLRALLEKKRRFEKIPGETRKIIAEQLGTTPAQVGRYDSIAKHLIAAFKTWLEEGKINISVAYELSTMSEREQLTALDRARAMKRGPSIDEVKRLREELRTPEPPIPAGGVTMVIADETGPAPTPEQMEEILERAKDRSASGAAVLPARLEDEAGAPKVDWTPEAYTGDTGKIVDFPTLPSPPPAEDTPRPEKEPMHKRMAANILEDLQMYCEEMLGIEAGLADTWMERADALAVAIAALRK